MNVVKTFETNYWSLYLNFLRDFKELTYRGFSIPYFCIYPKFVFTTNNYWKDILFDRELVNHLKYHVKDKREIQEEFNKYSLTHKNKSSGKNNHGKVVVHVDGGLRFPGETFQNFDASRTIILSPFKGKSQNKGGSSTRKPKVKVISNTVVLKRKSKNTQKGLVPDLIEKIGATTIPVHYLPDYSSNTDKAVADVQSKARTILKSYSRHPLYGDRQFKRTLFSQITLIINWIDKVKNYLEKETVSCIVISNPHFLNRILALAAAEKGIPTICMQHGLIGMGYLPKIATVDAVYGNFEKDWYTNLGIPEDAIKIIGHPKFDQLLTRTPMSRSTFNKRLGLDSSKKTLVVVVRETYDMQEWRQLIKTVSDKLSLNILIRDYPGRETNTLLKEFPFVHSTKGIDLYDILPNVDAVVAYPSTVGLEAMLLHKPVFILKMESIGEIELQNRSNRLPISNSMVRSPYFSDYFNSLGEMIQDDPIKLGEMVINYFNDPSWDSYAKKIRSNFLPYAYPDTTSSGKRLIKLINQLIT